MRRQIEPVPEQISYWRKEDPKSIALIGAGQTLTFEEFDQKANEFAQYLVQLGIVPGDTVAICLERCPDWFVSALGIMRAGAAYVPLDTGWPDSRVRFALEDSGAKAVVGRTPRLVSLGVSIHRIDPSRNGAAIAAAPPASFGPVSPEGLAYVIYTSGSTGVPKGVEITHANLCHLIQWHQNAFGVTHGDRASHVAGLGFDASVWEAWPNLTAGATLCLADDAVRLSPKMLQQWLVREQITVAFAPTVHTAALIKMEWPRTTSLRFLLTGGDVLQCHPREGLPFKAVNNYGPAECAVVATSGVLSPGARSIPTIGCEIAGATVYLLDESGEPVPEGTIGEIFIGGNGVARGYRNRPELNEQRFVADRFSGVPGARMYRSGDLAVRRLDGELEFHGRRDRQTKIRGQRIELDEIGNVLVRHSGLSFALASTGTSSSGEKELVAYVVLKDDTSVLTVQDLQEHLAQSLPDYMIPTTFVRLQSIPMSTNGKIDYSLLAEPADANSLPRRTAKTVTSAIAEQLLTIMRQVLKNDAVQAEDNFFLAGGHSLLAMQLVIRVRETFGVDLTVSQLFAAPTVERLSLTIEKMMIESISAMSEEEAQKELVRTRLSSPEERQKRYVSHRGATPLNKATASQKRYGLG